MSRPCLTFRCFAMAVVLNQILICFTARSQTTPNFGTHVFIFDPSMPMATIQSNVDYVFGLQGSDQFASGRYALFFKPGQYALDINVGFYTQVLGLGQSPDNVTITGAMHSDGILANHNATCNFTRSAENLAVVPTNASTMTWAVSQGTSLRRMHVRGKLNLANTNVGAW